MKLTDEAKEIREEYIRGQVNRRIDFRDGDATSEQIERWETEAAEWWDKRWPALAALPHLEGATPTCVGCSVDPSPEQGIPDRFIPDGDCPVHGEGATPAIDREALRAEERQRVAQSIRDEAVDEAVDGFVQLTAVIRMCEEAGR